MAVSLGGDTDTIASMAAAIAGAHSGVERIPDSLLKHCEARDRMQKYAEALCEIVAGDGSNGTNGQEKWTKSISCMYFIFFFFGSCTVSEDKMQLELRENN